jgi:hypothetical protein
MVSVSLIVILWIFTNNVFSLITILLTISSLAVVTVKLFNLTLA